VTVVLMPSLFAVRAPLFEAPVKAAADAVDALRCEEAR
jgi:hypothetical protein